MEKTKKLKFKPLEPIKQVITRNPSKYAQLISSYQKKFKLTVDFKLLKEISFVMINGFENSTCTLRIFTIRN